MKLICRYSSITRRLPYFELCVPPRDQPRLQAAVRWYIHTYSTSPALTLVFRIVHQESETECEDRIVGEEVGGKVVNLAGHCWPQSAMPTLSSAAARGIRKLGVRGGWKPKSL